MKMPGKSMVPLEALVGIFIGHKSPSGTTNIRPALENTAKAELFQERMKGDIKSYYLSSTQAPKSNTGYFHSPGV